MSAAFNFNGVGRVFKREAVALRRHLKRKTERLSSKLRPAPGHAPAARNSTANRFDRESLRETVRLAQQGDSAAFETIYQVHAKRVYTICLRMLQDPTEAEDALQDAFLQLFRKIQTFATNQRSLPGYIG
jgi:Sigma-70 region 2